MNLVCFPGCRLRISGPGQALQKYLWKKGREGGKDEGCFPREVSLLGQNMEAKMLRKV